MKIMSREEQNVTKPLFQFLSFMVVSLYQANMEGKNLWPMLYKVVRRLLGMILPFCLHKNPCLKWHLMNCWAGYLVSCHRHS